MKGDIIIIEQHHIDASKSIVDRVLPRIRTNENKYIITVSGESGSGKSETAKALSDELAHHGVESVILGQDDYFYLHPKDNDRKRREDETWLGPRAEVNMRLLNQHILDVLSGAGEIEKPIIDYTANSSSKETVSVDGIGVLIIEGTYTALLKHVDCRVFIDKNRLDTLAHRKERNRGNEVNDAFIEKILETEHKIISGFCFLADVIISRENKVTFLE